MEDLKVASILNLRKEVELTVAFKSDLTVMWK